MMRRLTLVFLFLMCNSLLAEKSGKFSLKSSTFINRESIPAKCATKKVEGGENISPGLKWKNFPEATKSFIITCIDHHPMAKRWVHWMVINIPADTNKIPEGASPDEMPEGCKELNNSFGREGYGGPQPPVGSGAHRYVFTVYALNVKAVEVKKDFLSEKQLRKLIRKKILAKTKMSGTFEQKNENSRIRRRIKNPHRGHRR